jgi:hypothetical protein
VYARLHNTRELLGCSVLANRKESIILCLAPRPSHVVTHSTHTHTHRVEKRPNAKRTDTIDDDDDDREEITKRSIDLKKSTIELIISRERDILSRIFIV